MAESVSNVVIAGGGAEEDISLLDVLDHVLHQGVIIRGNLVISLAGIDLIYVGLDVILTSVETALRHIARAQGEARASAARITG
ncbi:MAG TPA: gas vesicle protein [Candidatus Acidoferrales bacterium]|nr:gas vesicle protein [Candidatus Acidoferrales bacterium]